MRHLFGVLLVALLAGPGLVAGESARLHADPPGPRLLVVLVVDQMRSDYIDRYGHQWRAGLKRIVQDGARFSEAAYPYLNTVTCPGHATIATGRFPARHGMILNAWWDRETATQRSCTDDPSARTLTGTGALAGPGHSAVRLLAPTLGDALADLGGRVVSLSMKTRSAIMMAGHRGDVVAWLDDSGALATSSSFSPRFPEVVSAFLNKRPVEADRGKVWRKLLPAARYSGRDDAPHERPSFGWTRVFPHALDAEAPAPGARYYRQWARSPYADDFLADFAMYTVDALELGRGEGIDLLGISFSAVDGVGHGFGPDSHEVQDALARLDRTVGQLLAHLDRRVGRSRYTLALTADHGVAPIPEQTDAEGGDSGRIRPMQVGDHVNEALVAAIGPGRHVVSVNYTDLYLAPGAWQRISARPEAIDAALDAIASQPGVLRAFRGDELAAATGDPDRIKRAAALSYHPGRSGDLIMVPKPYWVTAADATTHGTLHAYDRRVPVVMYGAGIRPGLYTQAATPADIAPTLARLAGLPFKDTDGRALLAALGRVHETAQIPHR